MGTIAPPPPAFPGGAPPWPPLNQTHSTAVATLPPSQPVQHFPQFAAALSANSNALPSPSPLPTTGGATSWSSLVPTPASQSLPAAAPPITPFVASAANASQLRLPIMPDFQGANRERREAASRHSTNTRRGRGSTASVPGLAPTQQVQARSNPSVINLKIILHASDVS